MAIQSANQLVKTVSERNESYIVGGQQQKALATAVSKCKNQSLAELLRHGVGNSSQSFDHTGFYANIITRASQGFHTAELEPSDRNIVVELFISKHIHAVFCTSTLAAGVNLPSFLVVIKGTSLFAGGADKNREYSAIDLQQMAGRAGRPQFDTEGVCAIMTSDDRVDHFKGSMTAKIPIESKMKAKLVEHLNAEIVLETIVDIAQAVDWVCSTFYFTRACASPRCGQFVNFAADVKIVDMMFPQAVSWRGQDKDASQRGNEERSAASTE
jgi:replicative superfamily II helicase